MNTRLLSPAGGVVDSSLDEPEEDEEACWYGATKRKNIEREREREREREEKPMGMSQIHLRLAA